ncbi:MAG: SdrD B-like domain-containing protein [Ilumatobacteraceae bacterium]
MLSTTVRVLGTADNGSTFTSNAISYAVDNSGVDTAVPASSANFGPYTITSRPTFDVSKVGFFNRDYTTRNIGNGPEPGYDTYAVIQIASPNRSGSEALGSPIVVGEDPFFLNSANATYRPRYAIVECIPNPTAWAGTVGGRSGTGSFTGPLATAAVADSGTCTPSRGADPTDPYELTLAGIDMSMRSFPTRTANGSDLSAGPYYVASYRILIFVPLSEIDLEDGVADSAGMVQIFNRVTDFDPTSVTGTSNFGAGFEPGYCSSLTPPSSCALMPDTSRSNNVIGPSSIPYAIPVSGSMSKFMLDSTNFSPNQYLLPTGSSALRDGAAVMEPGQSTINSYVDIANTGATTLTNVTVCDVFDSTVLQLTPAAGQMSNVPATYNGLTGPYALVNKGTTGGTPDEGEWIIEYGKVDLSADNPIASGAIDPVQGRYNGVWNAQKAARCDDLAPIGGWRTDPALVAGGADAVNIIRAYPPTANATTQAGARSRLLVPFTIRSTFAGGPNNGQQIPDGVVAANVATWRATEVNSGNWSSIGYDPFTGAANGSGDRVTISRARLSIAKRTISVDGIGDGVAAIDTAGTAVAGNPIIWEIISTLSSANPSPGPVQNVTIIDSLPPYAIYDAGCTATLTGGTLPDDVRTGTRWDPTTATYIAATGYTTLTWTLGTRTPNATIPDRRICTQSSSLAPDNTSLVNSSYLRADGLQPRFDDHTVTLQQTGQVQLNKQVESSLDGPNEEQRYTLTMANFSQTLTIGAPTIIEVFPYDGDGTPPGSVNRVPASSFRGALRLAATPTVADTGGGAFGGTFQYTSDAPATINQNLNINTSTWCTAGQFGTAGCPAALSAVTAIKFIGSDALTPNTIPADSGVVITIRLQAGDPADQFSVNANRPGDRYSNRFTAFSSSFVTGPTFQVLASNRTQVDVLGFSVGDLVWFDVNRNGVYNAGTDTLAPDGTTVRLFGVGVDNVAGTADDPQLATTTVTGGRYLFARQLPGRVYIQIPSSEFMAGGRLAGLTAATFGLGAEDQNDPLSHDAVASASSATSGVRSTVHTLSMSRSGVTLLGDEPIGENIHGIVDGTATDSFSNLSIDLALVGAGSIGDRLWYDIDADGIQDADEPGIAGANITVTWRGPDGVAGGGDDVIYPIVVTDANGAYSVTSLPAGNFTVTVTALDPDFTPSFDVDGIGTPRTATVTLAPAQNRTDVDFGETVLFTLGDLVFVDLDKNGRYGAGDRAVPDGTVVQIHNATTGTIVATTTATSGRYLATGLPGGDYRAVIPSNGLNGASAAPFRAFDPNDNVDEALDHNAIAAGGTIRTNAIRLSATLSGTPSQQVTGDEPAGNGFTNLTLDLGVLLEQGIDLVKEVCTQPTVAQCDPASNAAWGKIRDLSSGGTAVFRLRLTNTGAATLAPVVVGDPMAPACGFTVPSMSAGETVTRTCSVNGITNPFMNVATVTGTPVDSDGFRIGTDVTDTDQAQVTLNGSGAGGLPSTGWSGGRLAVLGVALVLLGLFILQSVRRKRRIIAP